MESTSRPRRRGRTAIAVACLVVGLAPVALGAMSPSDDGAVTASTDAHGHNHAEHGGLEGHLEPSSTSNIELIGRMRINQDKEGRASDVGVHRNHAYVGAFAEPNCQKGGVYVFDLKDPARPKQVNFIRTGGNSYVGEGVQVVEITTPEFSGDVLVMNNEICGPNQPSTVGGVTFVDVTDPKRHRYLAKGVGDDDDWATLGRAHESHSAFMWDAGTKAYAAIVDNEEGDDIDILDITDPRRPEKIAEYNLNEDFGQIIDEVKGSSESFLHDMVVDQVGDEFHMLASYWDGGYVVLDVTNPEDPDYIGDTDFSEFDEQLEERTGAKRVPEGNAHQAEFTTDRAYFLAADEDFSPYGATAMAGSIAIEGANAGSDTPPLELDTPVSGQAVFVGRACTAGETGVAGPGTIAVAERGVCAFTDKVANIEAAGDPEAIVIFNRTGADGGCDSTLGMTVAGSTPTFGVIPRSTGFELFGKGSDFDLESCLAGTGFELSGIALGTTGPTIGFESYFDGWGYVRLFDGEPDEVTGKYELLDTFAIPEAHDLAKAEGFGDLSVHEVATSPTDPSLVYTAYYSGGFRVLRVVDEKIVEEGHWIGPEGSNFWGVQVWTPTSGRFAGEELVLASDRDYGVYVFQYTGSDDAGD